MFILKILNQDKITSIKTKSQSMSKKIYIQKNIVIIGI